MLRIQILVQLISITRYFLKYVLLVLLSHLLKYLGLYFGGNLTTPFDDPYLESLEAIGSGLTLRH